MKHLLSVQKKGDIYATSITTVLSFKEKGEWDLQAKYNIGKKIEDEGTEVQRVYI